MDLIQYLQKRDIPLVLRMSALLNSAVSSYLFIEHGRLLLSESKKVGNSASDIHKELRKAVISREKLLSSSKV